MAPPADADGERAGAAAGAAADGGEGGEGEEGRTDGLKLLLKLAFFVYVLGQDGGQQRIAWLSVGAALIFLAQTGRLDFLQRLALSLPHFTQPPNAPRPRQRLPPAADAPNDAGGGGAQVDAAGGGGAADAAAGEGDGAAADDARRAAGGVDGEAMDELIDEAEGFLLSLARDAESIVGSFLASLLPSYRPYDATGEDQQQQQPPPQQQAMAAGPGAF